VLYKSGAISSQAAPQTTSTQPDRDKILI